MPYGAAMTLVTQLDQAKCRTCKGPMIWVVLVSGERHPIEPAEVPPAVGVVAYRPDTGKAMVLSQAHVNSDLTRWVEKYGVTFHRSHFGSKACAAAERVNRDQTSMF